MIHTLLALASLTLTQGTRDPFQAPARPPAANDTCAGGANMTGLRASLERSSKADQYLVITWKQGTGAGEGLGPDYFARARLEADSPLVRRSLGVPDYRPLQELRIPLRSARPVKGTISFSLWFPDRSGFSPCQHSGMQDSYELKVSLTFNSKGQLIESTLLEVEHLGAI